MCGARSLEVRRGSVDFRVENMTVDVAPLPSSYLGLTFGNTILISPNAAGYGWYINPSSTNASVPAGRVDLLTVLVHEVGHMLGYGDTGRNNVMEEYLTPGVRLLPETMAFATSLGGQRLKGHRGADGLEDLGPGKHAAD